MLFDDLVGDEKPEPESAVIAADGGALEASEDSLQILDRDTDAAVLHNQQSLVALGLELDVDWLAAAVFDRVGNDITDRFVEPEFIRPRMDSVGDGQAKFGAAVQCVLQESLRSVLDHIAQVAGRQINFEFSAGQLRNVEQAIYQAAHSLRLIFGPPHARLNLFHVAVFSVALEQPEAQHERSYRQELVAHSYGGLRLLVAFALAQVGDDDSDRGALLEVHRIERQLRRQTVARSRHEGHLCAHRFATPLCDQALERVALTLGHEVGEIVSHDLIQSNADHARKRGIAVQDGAIFGK